MYSWQPLPTGLLSQLRHQYGSHLLITMKSNRFKHWWVIEINQPTKDTITELARHDLQVSRVDVAFDFLTPTLEEAEQATEFLSQHVVLKWRRDQRSTVIDATTYWSKKASRRNIALYGDRESKTRMGSAAHLELRFMKSAACTRAHLGTMDELLGINPFNLLQHQTKLVEIDEKKLEKAARKAKSSHPTRTAKSLHPTRTAKSLHRTRTAKSLHRTRTVDEIKSRMQEMIVRGKALCDLRSTFRNRFSRPLDWTDLAAEIDWCWLESGELISRDLDGSQFQKVVRICKNNLNDFNDLSGNRGILTAIYHRGCLSAAASLPRTKALAGCAAARLAAKVKSHANAGPKKRGGPRTDQAWQNRLWRAKIARPSLSRYALQSAVVGRREPVQRGCGPPVNCPNACPATTRPTGAIRVGQRGRRTEDTNPKILLSNATAYPTPWP